jgi:hypothetical protein
VGGVGRTLGDAVLLENITLHNVAPDEFAVEAYVHRNR